MRDNLDSYLVNALLDISLISNNLFIATIGNDLKLKTSPKSKSVQELENFIDQKCNELVLGSLKGDAEIK